MSLDYQKTGLEIGWLVHEKDEQYGRACNKVAVIMQILYPNGIKPRDYLHASILTRMLDKICRIANGYFDDSYRDIGGYATRMEAQLQEQKKDQG